MVCKKFALGTALVALLVLLWVTGGVVAGPPSEGPEGEAEAQGDVGIAAGISPTMSYQGRLVENDSPAEGARNMIFRFWTASVGGTKEWEEGPKSVDVTNGLFHVTLGDTAPMDVDDFDKALWLEVEVEGTTLPRQRLLGVPYAYSLVPGADVSGNIGAGWSVLYVHNAGEGHAILARSTNGEGVFGDSTSDHGVYAESNGSGLDGAALKAENKNTTNGIAIWAKNESADTTLALSNDGAGNLLKGFGGDGGEDEFRIGNDGTFETKADSYLFIPGIEFIKNRDTDTTRWDCQSNGSVKVWRGAVGGSKYIYIPITLPSVLYGRAVKVEKITVYYKCEDGTQNYITETRLYKQTDADSSVTLISDTTNRTNNAADDYSLDINDTLSSDQGILGLYLGLAFADDTNYIQIGGVRIQLGHHQLY
jgi:hypothetical protein